MTAVSQKQELQAVIYSISFRHFFVSTESEFSYDFKPENPGFLSRVDGHPTLIAIIAQNFFCQKYFLASIAIVRSS